MGAATASLEDHERYRLASALFGGFWEVSLLFILSWSSTYTACPAGNDGGYETMGNARRTSRWAALLVMLVAVLATAACGGGNGDGRDEASGDTTETSAPTDTTAAETTTTLSPEAEVEAAHDAYYAMLVRLVQAPDPHDPELTQRATGAALHTFVSSMEEDVALGRITQVGPNTRRDILHTEVSGDQATVEVCSVDDGVHTEVATGRVLDDDVVTRRIVHRLQRVSGVWLVAEATSMASWEGVTDCA